MLKPLTVAVALSIGLAPPAAMAAGELTEIAVGEPLQMREDRVYIVFRVHRPKGTPSIEPIFLRKPTQAELKLYREARTKAFDEARPKLLAERDKKLARKAAMEKMGRTTSDPLPPMPSIESFAFQFDAVQNLNHVDHNRPYIDPFIPLTHA